MFNKELKLLHSILLALVLSLSLSLNGCILAALNNPTNASMLSPEQIAAYRDLNVDIIYCLNVAGPPPAGSTTLIILPKDSIYIPTFGDGCHVISPPPNSNEITNSIRVPLKRSELKATIN